MRTYEELLQIENCNNTYCHDCNVKMTCISEKHIAAEMAGDLLEIREKITKNLLLRFLLKPYVLKKPSII